MKTPKKYSMIDADYLWFNISTSEWQRRRGLSRGLWTEYLPCSIQVMKIGTLEPGDQRMCLYRWTPGTVVMQIQGMESNSKLCWVSLFYLSETPGFRGSLSPLRSGKIEHLEINLFVYAAARLPPKCCPFGETLGLVAVFTVGCVPLGWKAILSLAKKRFCCLIKMYTLIKEFCLTKTSMPFPWRSRLQREFIDVNGNLKVRLWRISQSI